MEDLFKQFRKQLENRPEEAFAEADWQTLEKRLEHPPRRRSALLWTWLAWPLLFLLLASNLFFLLERRGADHLQIFRDTIVQTRVILQTDTIYVHRGAVWTVQQTSHRPSISQWSSSSDFFAPFATSIAAPRTDRPLGALLLARHEDAERLPPGLAGLLVRLPIRSFVPERPGSRSILTDLPPSMSPPPERRHGLNDLHLGQFSLGAAAGWYLPDGPEVSWIPGFQTGLLLGAELDRKSGLWLKLGYSKATFETDQMGGETGIPEVEPPADDFQFNLAEVPQPSLELALGLRYALFRKGIWTPYLGAGYGLQFRLPVEITYEFTNSALGVDWKLEQAIRPDGRPKGAFLALLGIDADLSRRWAARLQGAYRLPVASARTNPQSWGLQGSLFYRFQEK